MSVFQIHVLMIVIITTEVLAVTVFHAMKKLVFVVS